MILKKTKSKIILVGTPNFSAEIFEVIIQNYEVIAIICQPDRKVGRGLNVVFPPTKILAKLHNIKVFQPEKIIDIYDELHQLEFDLLLVVAYGQIIPESILKLASKGSYNIHFSLLPKYRGSSPIQYTLLNNESKTGITFMEVVRKMDAGDVIFQETILVNDNENFDSLLQRLVDLSKTKICNWIDKILVNDYSKTPQDETQVSFAPKITKEDEFIEFDTKLKTISKINALSTKPGAYLFYESNNNKKRLKIFKATKEQIKNSIIINCTDGSIYAIDYQFEGKKRIKVI